MAQRAVVGSDLGNYYGEASTFVDTAVRPDGLRDAQVGGLVLLMNVQVMGLLLLDAAPPTFLKGRRIGGSRYATDAVDALMSLRFHLSPPVLMSFSVMVKSELPTSKGMKVESYVCRN